MGEVKLVARTLDVFELYAQEGRPLSLTELSRGLQAPMSSTLALVRTLIAKGYLYEIRKRAGYYPTKRLMNIGRRIDDADSVANLVFPFLLRLRDLTHETVVLGKREGGAVIYLDVAESTQSIRYTAEIGTTRFLHANSLGKALLSAMPTTEAQKVLDAMDWQALTDSTLASRAALLRDLEQIRLRGWSENIGESVADLAAIAMTFPLGDTHYAISVAGPLARMRAGWDAHVLHLQQVLDELNAELRLHAG